MPSPTTTSTTVADQCREVPWPQPLMMARPTAAAARPIPLTSPSPRRCSAHPPASAPTGTASKEAHQHQRRRRLVVGERQPGQHGDVDDHGDQRGPDEQADHEGCTRAGPAPLPGRRAAPRRPGGARGTDPGPRHGQRAAGHTRAVPRPRAQGWLAAKVSTTLPSAPPSSSAPGRSARRSRATRAGPDHQPGEDQRHGADPDRGGDAGRAVAERHEGPRPGSTSLDEASRSRQGERTLATTAATTPRRPVCRAARERVPASGHRPRGPRAPARASMLSQKITRQSATARTTAPKTGPRTSRAPGPRPTTPSGVPRRPAGQRSATRARVAGTRPPPPMPWRTRPVDEHGELDGERGDRRADDEDREAGRAEPVAAPRDPPAGR